MISLLRRSAFSMLCGPPSYGFSLIEATKMAGVRAKTPPKGNRFNPDDETIRETITDIKASIEDGTRH